MSILEPIDFLLQIDQCLIETHVIAEYDTQFLIFLRSH